MIPFYYLQFSLYTPLTHYLKILILLSIIYYTGVQLDTIKLTYIQLKIRDLILEICV